jgi:hypothetical protein
MLTSAPGILFKILEWQVFIKISVFNTSGIKLLDFSKD